MNLWPTMMSVCRRIRKNGDILNPTLKVVVVVVFSFYVSLGWTTIVPKRVGLRKRLPTLVQTGLASTSKQTQLLSRNAKPKLKAREQDAHVPFYKFQIKQAKVDKLQKLREQFEADKKQVELMKQARKFKPH
jgi:hypothetical protein